MTGVTIRNTFTYYPIVVHYDLVLLQLQIRHLTCYVETVPFCLNDKVVET